MVAFLFPRILHRRPVPLAPSAHHPVHTRKDHDKSQHRPGIVHVLAGHGQRRREGQEDGKVRREQNRHQVDRKTPFSQRERPPRNILWAGEPLDDEEDQRQQVRDVQSEGAEGENGVKGGRGPDLNERQRDHDRRDEEQRADRDLVPRRHLDEKVREGQAVVARKGPRQPRHRRQAVEQGHPAREHAHGHDDVGGGLGAGGLVGDLDDGVARGAHEGFFVVAHAVEHGDDVSKGHDGVDDRAPDHGAGDYFLCVFDLFGHVDDSVDTCGC